MLNKTNSIIPTTPTSLIPIALTFVSQIKTPCSPRIPCTLKICHLTCLPVSKLVTKLNDQVGTQSLIDAKNKGNHQNRAQYYYAHLFFMIWELKSLYFTLLPTFYVYLNKNKKKIERVI